MKRHPTCNHIVAHKTEPYADEKRLYIRRNVADQVSRLLASQFDESYAVPSTFAMMHHRIRTSTLLMQIQFAFPINREQLECIPLMSRTKMDESSIFILFGIDIIQENMYSIRRIQHMMWNIIV
jgi:hypothetical protein